jgi:hypothetical protein
MSFRDAIFSCALGLGLCLASTGAFAQSSANNDTKAQPAIHTSQGNKFPDAPVAGRNSYTESEAKSRIESRGYGQVSDLQ